MHELQTAVLDQCTEPIIGYSTFNRSVVYVTSSAITAVGPDGKRQSGPISGDSVINFAVSKRKEVAILYKQHLIEIRRLSNLKEVVKKLENISIASNEDYPLVKILNQELYLVYPSAIEIISLKDNSRSKYTDLVSEPQFHKIYDLLLLNLIQSLSIGVLQLKNRLIVAIIPCVITELHIQGVSQILCLHSNASTMHPKTTYLVVFSEEIYIKIFDLTGLKQICEIEIPSMNAYIEVEADPGCQYLLVHYLHKQTCSSLGSYVYKINSAFYYNQRRNQTVCEPFILYSFEINLHEYLSPLLFEYDGSFHSFSLYYFSSQKLNLVSKKIVSTFRQSQQELRSVTDLQFWKQNLEWREIISTYLQIEDEYLIKSEKKMNYSEEQRQLEEYYEIAKDFDNIVARFSQILSVKNKRARMSQKQVEEEWEKYLEGVAKERHFMKETLNLFKIDYKVIKEPFQEKNLIEIQLQNCMQEMEGREGRVDAKIREKKEQLKQEQLKKEREREKEKSLAKPKLSQAQIMKEQEQYNKFVTEYLAEIERKQNEEAARQKNKDRLITEDFNPQFKLELPKLNEQEKKLIQHKSLDLSRMSSLSSHKQEPDPAWQQFVLILSQIEEDLSPLEQHMQSLIDKIDQIEHSSLEAIKKNEIRLQSQMQVDLEKEVRKNCKGMLQKLGAQIKSQMNSSMEKLYRIEEKSLRQNEQTIQKFKEYAKMQVRHRVELYHRSRRQLELTAHQIGKQQAKQQNTS